MIKLTTIVVSLSAIVAAATIPVTVTAGSRSNPFLDDSVREYQGYSAGSRYYYKKRVKKSKKRRKRAHRKNKRSTAPVVATENVRVQKELKTAGFYNGPLDGKLDSYESRVAVMQYQLSHGLPQTGELSPDLKGVLLQQGNIAELTEHLHNAGETQHDKGRRLQAALKVQGFYNATIDGDFGSKSQAAMRLYQQAKGMTPSGALLPEQEQELVAASIQQIQNQQAQADQALQQLASSQPSHQTTPSLTPPVQQQPASDQVMDQEEIAEQQQSAQLQQNQSDSTTQLSEVLEDSSAEDAQHDKVAPGSSQLAVTKVEERLPLSTSLNQSASNSSERVPEGDTIAPVDGDDNATGDADSNMSEIPGTDQHKEKSDWTCSKRLFGGCKDGALPLPEITSDVLQNGDTSDIHKICRPRDYDCVLKVMRDTGAGNQALRFFEHTGAFVSDFQELGEIDVVSADAAFAANVIHYELLVNGTPNLVSLESNLTEAERARPDIRQLREKGLSLFNDHFVRKESLAQGSRFIVEADFAKCNACRNKVFARAEFAHDVDSKGVYQGYQLLRVLPSSLDSDTADTIENLKIGEIHDTSYAGGCYCSFSPILPDGNIVANRDKRYLFISAHFSGNAWMNIDGRDVELSATQCNVGTYDTDAGERCVYSVYRASGTRVQIDLQATKHCPPESAECEVIDYDATITVEKEGLRQVVKAKGSCGC